MRVKLHPHNSVYYQAKKDKKLAAQILLPLIEFEFAFLGCQKPAITQTSENLEQLKILFEICEAHGWVSQKITKLGHKNGYWFKLSNRGFREIYQLAGPMADKRKDEWAKLLCERAEKFYEKDRKTKQKILKLLKEQQKLTTIEICLQLRKLPYTITRHLRNLEKEGKIKKEGKFWIISAGTPANSPS
ncbi:MAG: hypothetical protein DRJ35_05345 [Thermoprotei archaeon]|nr:MAG: hypothetical protein DRJ35_05345 [Thermoprotei archaeon]